MRSSVRACASDVRSSPARGARPEIVKASNHARNSSPCKAEYLRRASSQWCAVVTETAQPSRASDTAGARFSASDRRPCARVSSAQAAGAPGTVAGAQPSIGSLPVHPLECARSIESAFGLGPLAFKPRSVPSFQSSAKASLPMPFAVGSTTVSAAAVATIASTALPPFLRISSPACAACGCDAQTIPRDA